MGVVVLKQGHESHDHLSLVTAGHQRLIESSPGGVTRTYGGGKLFGNHGLLRGGPLPYQAEALTDARLALPPADVFHRLCDRQPSVRSNRPKRPWRSATGRLLARIAIAGSHRS